MKYLFSLSLALLLVAYGLSEMQRVTLTDPAALCLDGSPGIYYIDKGNDPKTVVIYFEGGGWCGDKDLSSTLENCYQRSKSYYGTTKNDKQTINPTDGIYSRNSNNHFREATRVFLRYCDGSGHQGSKQAPVAYKGEKLYFRGHNITIAQLNDLDKREKIFTQAERIIVTGGSAGGLAAFLWADYIGQRATTKKVYCAPDSGIFLDSAVYNTNSHAYANQFQNLFKITNVEITPPIGMCVVFYYDAPYKCMMAEYFIKFIQTPIFAIQSLYDSWSIPNILGMHCLNGSSLSNCSQKQRDYIEQYRKNTTRVMNEIGSKSGNGIWGLGCATHGFVHDSRFYSANYRIPMNSANSIDATLVEWINNLEGNNDHLDELPWPYNKPCSGVTSQGMYFHHNIRGE